MTERSSLEGSAPEITGEEALAEVIEQAFDYRGDVTIAMRDGGRLSGYLFNRRRDLPVPFVEIMPATGVDPVTLAYTDIRSIAFTGRDTAAGNSYTAWLKRKQAGSPAAEPSSGESSSPGA